MSPSIDHLAVAATTLEGRDLDDFLGVTLPPEARPWERTTASFASG